MYELIRGAGALVEGYRGIQHLDIGDTPTRNLMLKHRVVYAVIKDLIYNEEFTLDLNQYRNLLTQYDKTFNEWLKDMDGIDLTHSNVIIYDDYRYARFGDLLMSGYTPHPAYYEWHVERQQLLTMAGAKDLRFEHPKKPNYETLVESCLFTYNGHFIRGIGTPEGIYAIGGGKNYRKYNNNQLGCLSFANVSKLSTHAFTEDNIEILDTGFGKSIRVRTKKDISKRSVWVVIAGRLYFNEPILKKVGDYDLKINTHYLKTNEHLFDSRHFIDLDDISAVKHGLMTEKEYQSAELYKQLLLNENSFYIVFDNPHMGIYIEPMETYTYPATFATYDTHSHLVMLSNGLFPVFRERQGIKQRLIDVDIQNSNNYLSRFTGVNNGGNLLHDGIDHGDPRPRVNGYLFKVYSLVRI